MGHRTFVIGDPQAPFEHFLAILRNHRLLDDSDRLANDVHLISVGDHFDYGTHDLAHVATQGLAILRWLASHSSSQVTIIMGNHDAVRVMEFANVPDDATFAQAHAAGLRIKKSPNDDAERLFLQEFPSIPTVGYAARDFAAFTVEQRELVQSLLLQGRMVMAAAVVLHDGREALATHAGVTSRELTMLESATSVKAVADALNQFLANGVVAAKPAWLVGKPAALDLAPLCVTAQNGNESGGMLFHRPIDEPVSSDVNGWEFSVEAPRRFVPSSLPTLFTQIVGHTGHRKCKELLSQASDPPAAAHEVGGIRTLRFVNGAPQYRLGVLPLLEGAADLILIDGEMRAVPADQYQLMAVEGLLV
jgi:hypothetical protein